jgi:hypothetical protein
MTIDKHTLALISIVGSFLDVLGALYLAYDLLGGEHGPLRTLTRGAPRRALRSRLLTLRAVGIRTRHRRPRHHLLPGIFPGFQQADRSRGSGMTYMSAIAE